MRSSEMLEKLFDGWGTSDIYGNETIFLHETEVEKIAAANRAATHHDDSEKHPRGWPTDAAARRAFQPVYEAGDTLADFANKWRHLDVETRGGYDGVESPLARRAKLVLMIATTTSLIDD